jgi:TatD DNase family protein
MIDTHSHIYLDDFNEDRSEVMNRAELVGITDILMPAIDFGSLEQMDRLSHPTINFHKMVGVHPCDVKESPANYEDKLYEYAKADDIIGVGETGLDYYWSTDFIEEQKSSLKIHCKIAKALNKPIVLHNRESTDDLLQIIDEEQDGTLRGIWHCFNGTIEEGKRAIDMGLHLGIGGVVTFKNGGVDKTVKELPLNKMVLETDAPYLSPTPKRGKRNEPSFMEYTAKKLSELFNIDLQEVINKTTENSESLFDLRNFK